MDNVQVLQLFAEPVVCGVCVWCVWCVWCVDVMCECGVWHITIVVQGVVTGCDMGMAWWVWYGDVVWHGGYGMVTWCDMVSMVGVA